MSNHVRFIAVSAAAILTGCSTVGPDFQRPVTPTGGGYAMAGDPATSQIVSLTSNNESAQQWWKAYKSPKLDALVDQALKGNPTLQAADAALERVYQLERAQRGDSASTYRPSALRDSRARRSRSSRSARS
jgi:outer membrane protein TolC